LRERPPLDRGFFKIARLTDPSLTESVAGYMTKVYESNILFPAEDSLERVMGQVYTDTFNPGLKTEATKAFRALLRLFTSRVAVTTNDIRPTLRRFLYRMLTHYLASDCEPKDITIITYNQDLQVEKTLCLMSKAARWQRFADQIFNFPGCYALADREITSPTHSDGEQLFEVQEKVSSCIKVLKLHGSLNWYSSHTSRQPSQEAMFNPKRKLKITCRRVIPSDMRFSSRRTTQGLPIVVPPVTHKSAVLHDDMRGIWRLAEQALEAADELVIFGYSCPPLDFESANQLRRAERKYSSRISVIDPDGGIAARYIELLDPASLSYFSSAKAYLADRRRGLSA
jgi:hypothetical protein